MTPLHWRHTGYPRFRDLALWVVAAALAWGWVRWGGLGDGER